MFKKRDKEEVDPRDWYEIDTTLSFREKNTAELYRVWQSLRNGERIPHRRDFDPIAHVSLLPDIFMIEVSEDIPPRFRYRLIGTRIANTLGRDVTGAWLDELYGQTPKMLKAFDYPLRQKQPIRTYGTVHWIDKEFLSYESGIFPLLTDDNDRVGRFVGATVYTPTTRLEEPRAAIQSPSS